MLTLKAPQAETLWDELLPIEARELPEELARLDELLSDPDLLRPIAEHWQREAEERCQSSADHGRPTIAMETYVRLMVVKRRNQWGYETLVKEVSDSLHLRRFCLIPVSERVPDESTVRKLTLRLGSETVAELTRGLIAKAVRERRFQPRAARIDSTVVEADVRYPTDSGLAAHGVKALAREARKLSSLAGEGAKAVHDRSRSVGRRLRAISRTLARRSGERKAEVLRLTGECGELLRRSVAETRQMAAAIKRSKPTEFGYVIQLCELTSSTAPGQRGLILPPATLAGSPNENELLGQTVAELEGLQIKPREFALDGGFGHRRTDEQLASIAPKRTFIAGRAEPSRSRRTARRLARYRVGAEGRISHLKRGYGMRRTRLKGTEGQRIWSGWATFAYDLDAVAVLPA